MAAPNPLNFKLTSGIDLIDKLEKLFLFSSNDSVLTESSVHGPVLVNNFSAVFQSNSSVQSPEWWSTGKIQIPLYSVIFLLAVIGNSLVILTLVVNQRMRTITNLFLLNLAVSDLLLGVVCMPFTLIGALLRDFVFGALMCKLIPYLQASSVAVSVWTLVAISVERYYAICHPLKSLRWQTLSHAYKTIMIIWVVSLLLMLPIALLSELKPTNQGHYKCRESWPNIDYERAYNLLLDAVLLVLPLAVLSATYSLITRILYQGMLDEQTHFVRNDVKDVSCRRLDGLYQRSEEGRVEKNPYNPFTITSCHCHQSRSRHQSIHDHSCLHPSSSSSEAFRSHRVTFSHAHPHTSGLRRSNTEKALTKKKRVVKMLFAVVLEFFICWTPLYVINTIALFDPNIVYYGLGYTAITFFQLLAYSSSCCNPITYCFMNSSFRKSFVNLFGCKNDVSKHKNDLGPSVSDVSLNMMETKWKVKKHYCVNSYI